jgi:hypothetical protein
MADGEMLCEQDLVENLAYGRAGRSSTHHLARRQHVGDGEGLLVRLYAWTESLHKSASGVAGVWLLALLHLGLSRVTLTTRRGPGHFGTAKLSSRH